METELKVLENNETEPETKETELENIEDPITVSQKMAAFIKWATDLGEDEVRRRVREKLAEIKDHSEKTNGAKTEDGYTWDDALEPNDGPDQWKHGGDCNLCRRRKYCGRQCRGNRLLKEINTPYLYQMYVDEVPEAAAAEVAERLTPEDFLKAVGIKK